MAFESHKESSLSSNTADDGESFSERLEIKNKFTSILFNCCWFQHNFHVYFPYFQQQSEYEDQIAQLREELQTKSEELQHLKREIQQAKTGKDVGSKLLETQLQVMNGSTRFMK